MEDSNYFLKTENLESYISQEKDFSNTVSRIDIEPEKNENSENISEQKKEEISSEINQKTGNVQADDFFSSLELQSSSKTTTNTLNLNLNKPAAGIVTRSRTLTTKLTETLSKKPLLKSLKKEVQKRKPKGFAGGYRKRRRSKGKGKSRKPPAKKTSLSCKLEILPENKKQNLSKSIENIVEKVFVLEKQNKEDDDLGLLNSLESRKELEEKVYDKPILSSDARRCTPELFSMTSVLMSDTLSDGKDDVDKLLEVDDYDDSFFEEMDEYAPPRSHTGGKWKPGSLPIRTSPMIWQNQSWDSLLYDRNQEEDGKSRAETPIDSPTEFICEKVNKYSSSASSGGKWKSFAPPATYTGGKWKPLTPPATYTGGKWKPSEPQKIKKIDQETTSLENTWKCDSGSVAPPSTHTGGKWKPNSNTNLLRKNKSEESPKVPPPTHTRGKWVSETTKKLVNRSTLDVLASCQSTSGKFLKTAGGMIQYYCSPCNRRLSSKKMFKQHVQTELHFKRVLQENELEFDSRSLKMYHGLFTQSGSRERGLGKRVVKKPEILKESEEGKVKSERSWGSLKIKKKKVPRKEIRCEVCKIRMPIHQLGKHLVSYYHSRRIKLNDPQQQKLILDNIHSIVKQAPYQCGICKFYCNTHTLFKRHWGLPVHADLEKDTNKKFWCALCNYECSTSRLMELHLDSNCHREVILAVNKSIPIIIRQKTILNCSICFEKFRFNRELITHKQVCHGIKEVEPMNEKSVCTVCRLKCKNLRALQRHILHFHPFSNVKIPYFCSTCNEFFKSATEAKLHRNSNAHKCKKFAASGKAGDEALKKDCPYCLETLDNIDNYKKHLFEKHPEFLPKCIKCGMVFALSQEVTRHNKFNECSYNLKQKEENPEGFSCESCPYYTLSKSEYLLHNAIHEKKDKNEKKIECPLCKALYTQAALIIHLRSHLNEKKFHCSLCSKSFVKRDSCAAHVKTKHLIKKEFENMNVDSLVVKEGERKPEMKEKVVEEKKVEESKGVEKKEQKGKVGKKNHKRKKKKKVKDEEEVVEGGRGW